jgi:hypothetical protein
MKFEHNKALSLTARKRLIKGLTQVAELYFSADYVQGGAYPDKVNVSCGICKALHDLQFSHSYYAMQQLMLEMDDDYYGKYVYTPQEWEPRANMCLFLVEYLKDTIEKEKA